MRTNKVGIDLIKSFEDLRLESYQDLVGIWTIGYGHTHNVAPNMFITPDEADHLFVSDLIPVENAVNHYVTAQINENEFSALVSFAFNVGVGALQKSTLLKLLNSGDRQGAADEFLRWNKAGGKEVRGLTVRRQAERELFLTPTNNSHIDDEIGVKLD